MSSPRRQRAHVLAILAAAALLSVLAGLLAWPLFDAWIGTAQPAAHPTTTSPRTTS